MVAQVATLFVALQAALLLVAAVVATHRRGRRQQRRRRLRRPRDALLPARHLPGRPAPVLRVGRRRVLRVRGRGVPARWPPLARSWDGATASTRSWARSGLVFGLLVVDMLLGAPLQLNTVFGYSPTVGGRFAGMGNLAYGQFAGAAFLLTGLLVHRIADRRRAVIARHRRARAGAGDRRLADLGLRRRRRAGVRAGHRVTVSKLPRHPDPGPLAGDLGLGHRSW